MWITSDNPKHRPVNLKRVFVYMLEGNSVKFCVSYKNWVRWDFKSIEKAQACINQIDRMVLAHGGEKIGRDLGDTEGDITDVDSE